MRMIDPILMEIEMEGKTTRRVLERVPEDKLGWRPHPKSMSLGELALHIATTPAQVARLAAVDTMEAPNFTRPEPANYKEVLDAHDRSQVEARETLSGMDDAFLGNTWTLTRGEKTVMAVPRIGFVRSVLLNHGYHHRGQLCVYLRLLEVPVPSVYGPSADENPFV
jgi:uncharacterized damage-inducible protein DinB